MYDVILGFCYLDILIFLIRVNYSMCFSLLFYYNRELVPFLS